MVTIPGDTGGVVQPHGRGWGTIVHIVGGGLLPISTSWWGGGLWHSTNAWYNIVLPKILNKQQHDKYY